MDSGFIGESSEDTHSDLILQERMNPNLGPNFFRFDSVPTLWIQGLRFLRWIFPDSATRMNHWRGSLKRSTISISSISKTSRKWRWPLSILMVNPFSGFNGRTVWWIFPNGRNSQVLFVKNLGHLSSRIQLKVWWNYGKRVCCEIIFWNSEG